MAKVTRIALDPRKVLRVAGAHYRVDAILTVCAAHPERRLGGADDTRVYLLDGELVPEPENRADPAAIAVLVDGQRVGYVPAELCPAFHGDLDIYAPWIAEVEVSATITGASWVDLTFDRRR